MYFLASSLLKALKERYPNWIKIEEGTLTNPDSGATRQVTRWQFLTAMPKVLVT